MVAKINKKTGQVYRDERQITAKESQGVKLETFTPRTGEPTKRVGENVVSKNEYEEAAGRGYQARTREELVRQGLAKPMASDTKVQDLLNLENQANIAPPLQQEPQVKKVKMIVDGEEVVRDVVLTPQQPGTNLANAIPALQGTAAGELGAVEAGLLGAGATPNALTGVGKVLNIGKTEVAISEQAVKSAAVKSTIRTGFVGKLAKNKIVQGALGYFAFSKILGAADKRVSDIESSVGKRGERISKLAELASQGYPPEEIYQSLLTIENEVAQYEETLAVLRQRNPELILNPEAMDSAYAEVAKIKTELLAAKIKTLNAAANPIPENTENLALIFDELNLDLSDIE